MQFLRSEYLFLIKFKLIENNISHFPLKINYFKMNRNEPHLQNE